MAYPAMDPVALPAMRADVARVLVGGRASLMRRIRAAEEAAAGGGEGGRPRVRADGATEVPVRGLDGLKEFLRKQHG